MTEPAPRKSDLGVRVVSAVVMVAVAGTALWLGGWVWVGFVGLIALAVFWEWTRLAVAITSLRSRQIVWLVVGLIYVSTAAVMLASLGAVGDGIYQVGMLVASVIGVDVGAYFAGRTIGGPKIAPSISPSKTWAGLMGGIIGATLILALGLWGWHAGLCDTVHGTFDDPTGRKFGFDGPCSFGIPPMPALATNLVLAGVLVASVAQAGDFFESWMKRRAGVKDSGTLIPGHGGFFDRVDGLLAVAFVFALIQLWTIATLVPSGI